jgi:hypothetical protein
MPLPVLGGSWLLPPRDFSQPMRVTLWITTAIHLDTLKSKDLTPTALGTQDDHHSVNRGTPFGSAESATFVPRSSLGWRRVVDREGDQETNGRSKMFPFSPPFY